MKVDFDMILETNGASLAGHPWRRNQSTSRAVVAVRPQRALIPRIIHQTAHSRALPPRIEENIARIRASNPGWDYRFYGDHDVFDFIRSVYGADVLARFERINPRYGAARADLFRYLLMYHVGGVYLDIKAAATRPLDEVLRADDGYVLCQWPQGDGERYKGWGVHRELVHVPGGEYQQWHIVCAPGSPLLKAVIENVLRNIDVYHPGVHGLGRMGVLRVTGPIAYTLAIAPLVGAHPHRFADSERELGIAYTVFGAENVRAHRELFRFHYAQLNEPVVQPKWMRRQKGGATPCQSSDV